MRHFLLFLPALFLTGCSTMSFYWQAFNGQMEVTRLARSLDEVLADPATNADIRRRLAYAQRARDYASAELGLPDNASYRRYTDLKRPFVVWNVFAAAEFAVEPKEWCFLVVGCVGYRGYFAQADGEAYARELRGEGLDVFVSGVPAYSTLGWFDDPVLNTFINYPGHSLSRLIFHELAHQVVYVKGDTEFNESFATAIETEGVRRWIARHGNDQMRADFERSQQWRTQFRELVFRYRERLGALYRLPIATDEMRVRKAQVFSGLRRDYELLKSQWGGFAGYDRFFDQPGNAHLASIAIYTGLVPQFQLLLAKHHGDLAAFYAEVKALAALGKAERASRLAAVVAFSRQEPL